MRSVPLTNSYSSVVVDDEDFRRVFRRRWYLNGGYVLSTDRPQIYLHHLINGKPPEGMETDHRDGNGLNNQRGNLRNVTHSQNKMNRGKQKSSTSGFKGVCWDKQNKKWKAQIGINGKVKCLGYFDSLIEAAKGYDRAVRKLHGKFARPNFPMRFPRLMRFPR